MSLNNVISPVDNNPDAPFFFGYTEFKESAEENLDWLNGTVELTRVFDGPWENRLAFVESLLARVDEVGGTQVIFNPAFYPGYDDAFAYKCAIKGKLKVGRDTTENIITFDMARITVNYTAPKFKFPDKKNPNDTTPSDRLFVEESLQSSIEILPIKIQIPIWTGETTENQIQSTDPIVGYEAFSPYDPLYPSYDNSGPDGGAAALAAGFTLKEDTVNKTIVIFNYKLKIPIATKIRWANIQEAAGKINSKDFITPSGLIAAPNTLRYDGVSAITKREISGKVLAWEIEHDFAFYKSGWNTRPTGFSIDKEGVVLDAPILPHLYKAYDLNLIFSDKTHAFGI